MHKYKKNVKDEGTYNEYMRLKELAEMKTRSNIVWAPETLQTIKDRYQALIQ